MSYYFKHFIGKEAQAKSVALDMSGGDQSVAPDAGKVLSGVTIQKPSTFLPENIKKDVVIGGITGTHEGGGQQPTLNAPTISSLANVVSISNPSSNGNFVTGYEVYKNGTHIEDIANTTYTVTSANEGNITVKAKGTNFIDSSASNSILVTHYPITVNCTNCTETAGNPSIIYNTGSVTLYFTPNTGLVIKSDGVTISGATIDSVSQEDSCVTIKDATGNVTLNVTAMVDLVPGLYDASDNLLATYADSGLYANLDFFPNYDTDSRSGYCTMQRYPTCVKIVLPDTIANIGIWAFMKCTRLTSIIIPEGVTSIRDGALNSAGLTSVIIPYSVTTIGGGSFDNCSNLTNIIIPLNVRTISEYAFRDTGLTSATFTGTPSSIDSSAFMSYGLTDIYVPWAEGAVAGAPWGASNATIHYNS